MSVNVAEYVRLLMWPNMCILHAGYNYISLNVKQYATFRNCLNIEQEHDSSHTEEFDLGAKQRWRQSYLTLMNCSE